VIIECDYLEPHEHDFPDDWILGGADGTHPGADPRWKSVTYTYYDESFRPIETTSVPTCQAQALDEFTKVANYGPGYNPVYISAKQPGEPVGAMLPFKYSKEDDSVRDIIRAEA
jgi:hypothetical protein